MALAGLWHGAKWNFVFWGLYHGLLLCVTHALLLKNNARPSTVFSKSVSVFVTFIAVCFGWILFRSSDLSFFYAVMNNVLYNFHWDAESTLFLKVIGINSVGVAIYHWIVEKYGDDTALLAMSPAVKVFTYTFMVVTINAIGFGGMPFIYFQF